MFRQSGINFRNVRIGSYMRSTILGIIHFIRVSSSAASASQANNCFLCFWLLGSLEFWYKNNGQSKDTNNSRIWKCIPFLILSRLVTTMTREETLDLIWITMYGLNNSCTKTIYIGLQSTNEEIFKPLVKLSGHNADEIYFDTNSFKITWDSWTNI